MAPPSEFVTVQQRQQGKPKGKSVRFADDEGHDLCEVFHINCSSSYMGLSSGLSVSRNRWKRAQVSRPKPLTIYNLPWDRDLLFDRLERLNVSLENIVKTQKGIIGMVAVKNIAYCKEIFIKYSFDNWETERDTQGAFYKQEQAKQVDYFVFVVSDKAACFDGNWELNFAICYKVGGREFWDNNDGKNYEVTCK